MYSITFLLSGSTSQQNYIVISLPVLRHVDYPGPRGVVSSYGTISLLKGGDVFGEPAVGQSMFWRLVSDPKFNSISHTYLARRSTVIAKAVPLG